MAIQLGERFGMWPEAVLHTPGSLMWAHRVAVYQAELDAARERKKKD